MERIDRDIKSTTFVISLMAIWSPGTYSLRCELSLLNESNILPIVVPLEFF